MGCLILKRNPKKGGFLLMCLQNHLKMGTLKKEILGWSPELLSVPNLGHNLYAPQVELARWAGCNLPPYLCGKGLPAGRAQTRSAPHGRGGCPALSAAAARAGGNEGWRATTPLSETQRRNSLYEHIQARRFRERQGNPQIFREYVLVQPQ